jgi:hypothetical protein
LNVKELRYWLEDLDDEVDIAVVSSEPHQDLQIVRKDSEIIFYIGPLDLDTVDTDEFFEN